MGGTEEDGRLEVMAEARRQVMKARTRQVLVRVKKIAVSPIARPVEVWAVRAAYGYIAIKLGIAADHAVR